MFQNIKGFDEKNPYEDVEVEDSKIKEILKKSFSKKMIILYVVTFLLSCVSFQINKELAPFGLSMLVAILSSCNPIGIATIFAIIGSSLFFGAPATLNLMLTLGLVFFTLILRSPKYDEEANEKRKLGKRLFICTLIVQILPVILRETMIYDVVFALIYSIATYIFYKIFVNSITVITSLGEKRAYSIEEVMGASLIFAIAACVTQGFNICGYSIKNILCVLIVLIMGWKNGILVGGTTGITVGSVVGIITGAEPTILATYALSGMIAGIFNKLGKIGVIIGFILGNVLLTYVVNGNTVPVIALQEILIAALGLLVIPKSIKINIEDINKAPKLLPEITGRTLEENKEAAYKLNNMSETIYEMAKTYKEAAATIVDEDELKKQEEENFVIFVKELENGLDEIEDNILFDDIYNPSENFLEDLFDILLENEIITRKDLLNTMAAHNNYIVGYDREYINDSVEEDIDQMIKVINYSYKVSKLSFIWKKKLDENKKIVSDQLEEVSKAIGKIANEIENETEENDEYKKEQKEIKEALKEQIEIKQVKITKSETGRIKVTLYSNCCVSTDEPDCNTKKMSRVISKIFNENMVLQKQECGLRQKLESCKYVFLAEDKLSLEIGMSKTSKADSNVSGDTTTQVKLEDGKILVALSDGMGSGEEAKKASRTVIAMLEKLIESGFEKDTALKLINSNILAIGKDDMYATLDMAVLDLYKGKMEFVKSAACPTYVKHYKNVEILKNINLPTGIVQNVDNVVYNRDLEENDIIVMCSDGILDSSEEYTNKELWLKFLLEELETDDVQKIADIIMQEAIDNNYGKPKDDMSVIVMKIGKK